MANLVIVSFKWKEQNLNNFKKKGLSEKKILKPTLLLTDKNIKDIFCGSHTSYILYGKFKN